MHNQIASFYKNPGLIRLNFMDVNHALYNHMDRIAAAIEKAILTEEAQTLGIVIKDIQLIQRRMAKAEAEGGPGVMINPNILSDNNDNNKGSGVLRIREVWASRFWNNYLRRLN